MPVRGNHGDVVTSAVDDCIVDSRFCGNDEMRSVGCPGQPRRDCPYEVQRHLKFYKNQLRKVHRVARTGLATFLFAVLRPRHAKAVTMDANALRLEYGSGSSEISLGKIESVEIKSGWIWSTVQLRHDGGESVVSGLSSYVAQDFYQGTGDCQNPLVAAGACTPDRDNSFGLRRAGAACRACDLPDAQCV